MLGGAVVFAATQDFFGAGASKARQTHPSRADRFDGARAWRLVKLQLAYGQRPGGSPQLRAEAERLRPLLPGGRFEDLGPAYPGLRNIVGELPGRGPPLLIGAHYDTQSDPQGFVGANDSAAGTAAVLELARALRPARARDGRAVRFVLFDGEEQPAGEESRPFASSGLRGSRAYVAAHRDQLPREMVLLDYIAGRGAVFRREQESDPRLWGRLRAAAQAAGVGALFPAGDQSVGITDDTTPFERVAVPAVDVIDWGYPYKQGVHDTIDKLDPRVLDGVGEAVAELARRGG
ncbi:MAG TPA: M28 family peptidase [Solirubrobacteraceae bacterium]|nr:M28 family peptidase [Solirubrobacteraceae bacterium]